MKKIVILLFAACFSLSAFSKDWCKVSGGDGEVYGSIYETEEGTFLRINTNSSKRVDGQYAVTGSCDEHCSGSFSVSDSRDTVLRISRKQIASKCRVNINSARCVKD
jgi:hypothetical protein